MPPQGTRVCGEEVDELALVVHPVVLGTGMRLFDEMTGQISLKLMDSRALSTGVLSVTYQPASAWAV